MGDERTASTLGLRERKKIATRKLIVQSANRLFRENGYDVVTLEQVADESFVSVRTVLRSFGTKEALALAPEHELLEAFRLEIGAGALDAVTCWRNHHAETIQLMKLPESRRRLAAIVSHPVLYGEFLRIGHTYEDLLTAAIDEETDRADPLGSRLFATVLVSGTSAAFRQWLTTDEPFDIDVLLRIVDYAAETFHPLSVNTSWSLGRRRRNTSTARGTKG